MLNVDSLLYPNPNTLQFINFKVDSVGNLEKNFMEYYRYNSNKECIEVNYYYDYNPTTNLFEYNSNKKLHCHESNISVSNITNHNLEIYPNPVQQNSNLNIDGNINPTHAFLFNYLGQNVATFSLRKGFNTISLESLPMGIYMLQIDGKTYKINKQ